ncbi:hypothetical protein QA601_09105 [Chitinispirillales bacterium ANBcel5]|uniref:hypothetical protein n=1 Tax=Cellulosispirillum alkaliphilum TaxID=3039283 RepID=UPI002A513702|nr:hypothetical protein [Chitinispirillales bacterium ANBcel5]
MKLLNALAITLLLFTSFNCQRKPEDPIAKVGRTYIDQESFDAFNQAISMYPAEHDNSFFPGRRSPVSYMVEVAAIYSSRNDNTIRRKMMNSADWKWKERYYPAQLYSMEILAQNLGFSEEDLYYYYIENQNSFITESDADENGDAETIEPFENVKRAIADSLFWDKHKPDSAFLAQFEDEPETDSLVIRERWIYTVRSNVQDFFMRLFFEEKYGEPYSDDLDQILGDDKIITEEDITVITSWIPSNRVTRFSQKDLAEWLLRWKLISEKATQSGFTSENRVRSILEWAKKAEYAKMYVNERLLPDAKDLNIDTTLAILSLYDQYGYTPNPEPQKIKRVTSGIEQFLVTMNLSSKIQEIRDDVSVEFFQSDWKDNKYKNPAELITKADSLAAINLTDEALELYNVLIVDFGFTEEGKRALIESAKISKDNSDFQTAIRNYRQYQLMSPQLDCNTFFMLGFIYDEHLKNPELAEVNYRWILRNTPDCELAEDTEFMLLHLDEPISSISIEELRDQTIRQNRNLDFGETELAEIN